MVLEANSFGKTGGKQRFATFSSANSAKLGDKKGENEPEWFCKTLIINYFLLFRSSNRQNYGTWRQKTRTYIYLKKILYLVDNNYAKYFRTFWLKVIHQPLAAYFRLRPSENISCFSWTTQQLLPRPSVRLFYTGGRNGCQAFFVAILGQSLQTLSQKGAYTFTSGSTSAVATAFRLNASSISLRLKEGWGWS